MNLRGDMAVNRLFKGCERRRALIPFVRRHHVKGTQHQEHLILGSDASTHEAGVAAATITAHTAVRAAAKTRRRAAGAEGIVFTRTAHGSGISLE